VKNLKVPEIKEIREMEIESKLLIETLPSYRLENENSRKNLTIDEQNEDFMNSDSFFSSKKVEEKK